MDSSLVLAKVNLLEQGECCSSGKRIKRGRVVVRKLEGQMLNEIEVHNKSGVRRKKVQNRGKRNGDFSNIFYDHRSLR